MKIVGIGGLPRSGKDSLADLFIEQGWFGFSFGDFTRARAYVRHKDKPDPISVTNMTETSNWLRDTKGADVILLEALGSYEDALKNQPYSGLVLFSIRAPIEVDFILARGGELIWVEASAEIRYKRAMEHLRSGENRISLEEFQRQELLQWKPQEGIPVEAQMDTSYVMAKATHTLVNNGDSFKEFQREAQKLINMIGKRPHSNSELR